MATDTATDTDTATPPSAPTPDDPLAAVTAPFLRHLYAALTGVSSLGVVYAGGIVMQHLAQAAVAMLLGYGALGLICWVAWRAPIARARALLAPVMLGGMLAVAVVCVASGWGLLTPGLTFLSLAVLLSHLAGSRRMALAATAMALALVIGLGLAELLGLLGMAARAGVPPVGSRGIVLVAAILTGAVLGAALARLLRRNLQEASAREQHLRALAGTEARYQDLFQRLPTALLMLRDGEIVEANAAAAHLLGYPTPAAMVGQPLRQADPPAAGDADTGAAAASATDTATDTDTQLLTTSGRPVPVRLLSMPAQHRGQPARLSICIDESAPRAAAQALARSQHLLAQVVALSPDVITLTEIASGRLVMVNDSFSRLLGHPRAQSEGRLSTELGVWRDPADRDRLAAELRQHGQVHDRLVQFVTRQGQAQPLLVSGVRFESEGVAYLLLNGRDITEATRVQQEREAILAHASVGIAFTRDRHFVLANARFEQMYGWGPGGLVGRPIATLWDDAAHFKALSEAVGPALLRGEAIDVERQGQRHDGSRFRVRLRAQAIDPRQPTTSGTIWIAEDVSQAYQAELDLARARDAAEAANRAKSAFLANTSHEIRTPLHGVLGLARLAREPGLPAARRQLYLDQLTESAQLLSAIISDILDVAKIEAGRLQLETAPFDLRALLQSLQQVYAALAHGQGLGFTLQIDPALPAWVLGDALRVRQVLVNFLQNALKFCAQGQVGLVVSVMAGPGGWLRFEVHDTGPGIPPEIQARLFEPFTQADVSTTRRFGGTGLGLSICRELAGLMGGQVGLSSLAGQGSRFHAELPLPAAAAPALALAAAAPQASQRLQGLRVLLVEDNPVNLLVGVAVLERWGVQVTEATDGAAALRALDAAAAAGRPIAVVLMDLQMPGMSGFETTRALRQRHPAAQLPVIALTAAALVSERERALAHGMTDFLSKPLDPQRLLEALLRALPEGSSPSPVQPAGAA